MLLLPPTNIPLKGEFADLQQEFLRKFLDEVSGRRTFQYQERG